jgi:hypothetical protein
VLLRCTYLAVTNLFALLRLLPSAGQDKNAEILALRHQITVLRRQLGATRPRFSPVRRILRARRCRPGAARRGHAVAEVPAGPGRGVLACGFLTVDTVFPTWLHVLFVVGAATRPRRAA